MGVALWVFFDCFSRSGLPDPDIQRLHAANMFFRMWYIDSSSSLRPAKFTMTCCSYCTFRLAVPPMLLIRSTRADSLIALVKLVKLGVTIIICLMAQFRALRPLVRWIVSRASSKFDFIKPPPCLVDNVLRWLCACMAHEMRITWNATASRFA